MTLAIRIRTLVSQHWVAMIHAVAMATIVALPVILYPFLSQQDKGMNIAHFGTDQHFYLTRGRDVLDGRGLGNSLLREGKDHRDPFAAWGERVMLAPYRLLGVGNNINVVTLYTILNAIGIVILTLLLYALVYQLSDDKRLSILAAVFVIAGSSLVFTRSVLTSDPILYGRAMFPYVSSIATCLYLNALVRYLKRPNVRHGAIAALTFGVLFYVYLFAWTYVLTLNGVLILAYAVWRNWPMVKGLALIVATGLLLGAYNLFRLFSFLGAEQDGGVTYFHYLEHSRAPLFSTVGAVLIVLLVAYVWKHRRDERLPLLVAFIATGWIVLNQQIITGIKIQPGHYYWYFIVPFGIVIALLMVFERMPRNWRRIAAIALLVFVYANAVASQTLAARATLPAKDAEQRFRGVIDELNRDTDPTVVFMAGDDHAYLVPIYTHHDIFWHDAASLYAADIPRLRQSLVAFMLLHRDARQDPEAFLRQAAEGTLTDRFYIYTYRAIEGATSGYEYYEYGRRLARRDESLLSHRETLQRELLEEFQRVMADPEGLLKIIRDSGVEYVIWDERLHPEWDMSLMPGLHELLQTDGLHLYRLEEAK
jgi:hypothetical protein